VRDSFKCDRRHIYGQQAASKSDEDGANGELREHLEELSQLSPHFYNSAVVWILIGVQ
jgi:hypothetical protein